MKQSLPLYQASAPLPSAIGEAALPFAVLSLHSHDGRSFLDDVTLHHLAGGLNALGLAGDLVVAHLPPGDRDRAWQSLIEALRPYRTVIYERIWSADVAARLRRDLPGVVLVRVMGEHPLDGAAADHVLGPALSDVYAGMLALAGRAPSKPPSDYAPNLRPVYATPRHAAAVVSFPIVGNTGCPHQDDARVNPLFAGIELPKGTGRGCSFCTTGNNYEHRPKAEAIEHALVQLRYLRSHAPEITTLVLRDQNPFYYLTELVEAAERERLGPFSLLLESRADWFLQNAARFVRAMESARRSSIKLCPFLVGIESFSQPELDRFNKNMEAETNQRFVEALWAWTETYAPAIDLSHAAFGFILFTPWTTLDDLRANLAAIRRTKMNALRGHLLLSRARLYPDTALYYLAQRDGLLADVYERDDDDASARYGYLPATPWRFRDPRVARIAELGGVLTSRGRGGDEAALLEALLTLVGTASDPAAVTADDVERVWASQPARTSPEPEDVHEILSTAINDARSGRLATARARLRRAVERSPGDAVVHVVAGLVAFVTRDYGESIELLTRAASLDPGSAPRVYAMVAERAGLLGWDRDQLAAIDAWLAASPGDGRAHAAAARLHLVRRNWDGALSHLERAASGVSEPGMLDVERARVLVELGRFDQSAQAIAAARARLSGFAFEVEAGHLLRAAGFFDDAEACFARAISLEPDQVSPRVASAELSAWRGDVARARRELAEALARDPSSAAALRAEGALDAHGGDGARAERSLRRALELDPHEAEAHAWLGELALGRGDFRGAERALAEAVAAAEGYAFAALVLRALTTVAEAASTDPQARCAFANFQEIAEGVDVVVPGGQAVLARGLAGECRALLSTVIERLGRNRSIASTYDDGGTLRALPRLPGVRFRARQALQVFRLLGLEPVRARLTAIAARYPESSLPLCHLGEAELWSGDLEAARATLEKTLAISSVTRWAWIGLTAIETLSGRPTRALELSDQGIATMWGTVGPAVYVHRGDAYRVAGRLAEARVDLARAVELHPRRVSARLCLAAVLAEQGHPADAVGELARVAADAPGLVSDAARELGVAYWGDEGKRPSPQVCAQIVRRAIQMLRGNRSASSITYFAAGERLRGCDFGGRTDVHARDVEWLDQARRMIERVRRPQRRGSPPSGRGARPPQNSE